MSESTSAPAPAPAAGEPRHGLRILTIWLPLAIIADLLIGLLWYPHIPPGRMSDQAQGQQFDIGVMALMCTPVVLFVWVYAAYALTVWRRKPGDEADGAPIAGNTRVQATWITVTSVIVLGLFVFGTVQLILPAGAGAGEGPSPIWKPSGSNFLQVQAIGQQWTWSFRYPQFGGMETTQMLLPLNRQVEIHVTSLDVIHSFWSYQLGVKADANPGVDNVAFFKPQELGTFIIRCNELCGIWHGAMFTNGHVVSPAAFQTWATAMQAKEQRAGVLAALPPYATTYDPTTIAQLGKTWTKVLGITGSPGYYYSPANPVQP
ncbi:MAG TPA: cytochrome c oxidase subunit II [Streptosporangiaceae bacterium]